MPRVRKYLVIVGLSVFVTLTLIFQSHAITLVRLNYARVRGMCAFAAYLREQVRHSPHPELYQPGAKYDYVQNFPTRQSASASRLHVVNYAFSPARVSIDSQRSRVVVLFSQSNVEQAEEYAQQHRLKQLDNLGETVRVYERLGN